MNPRYLPYRKALRALRAECPVDLPIRIRLHHRPSRIFGWTTRTPKGYSITICTRHGDGASITKHELKETIIHEWAHAMTGTTCTGEVMEHDALWGVAYATAYRATVED